MPSMVSVFLSFVIYPLPDTLFFLRIPNPFSSDTLFARARLMNMKVAKIKSHDDVAMPVAALPARIRMT